MKIAGSFLKIQDQKDKIENLDKVVDYLHFDIMDGKFTERPTLDLNIMKNNLDGVTKPIDVHLMTVNVLKYVNAALKFNPSFITFHIEATNEIDMIIKYIKSHNVKVGLAINPETDFDEIYPYLDCIDLVLLMSVPPGAGGRKFIDISKKINELYEFRRRNNLSFIIEVDGGINDNTIKKVSKADMVVAGSYITDSEDYLEKVNKLREATYE